MIGNASAHDSQAKTCTTRGVFDKETRRKPLVFAAGAAAMGIGGRFGTRRRYGIVPTAPDHGLCDVNTVEKVAGNGARTRAMGECGGIGVKLMRAAFSPDNGPLTDMTAEAGERVGRMELFAGAMGSYKNPQSHRDVNLENPHEALEIILFANHLLRIVDARTKI